MFALFFVRRPVFAIVIAVITVLVGLLALTALPIAQYPEVVPPQVVVTAFYPGANAQTVAATVASPIEEQINGVENMLYMESQCTNDGSMRLTVTFRTGTNPDTAQVLVQNRVAIAQPKLPDVVKAVGVTTKKQSSAILLVVSLYSPPDAATGKPKLEQLEVSNYARLQVKDDLARIQGVGDVFAFGEREYSMRVWLDPDRMADNNLSASDVATAVRTQNTQVAAGQIGQSPAPAGTQFQMVVNTQGRLADAKAFEEIVIKAGVDGMGGEQLIRLRDVGRAELGARNYDTSATLDGRPSVGLPIFQLPGANAFKTAEEVRTKMKELRASPGWPGGIEYAIIFDPTTFIEASVEAVIDTLVEAIILVALVVLVFLQSWRAAVIPMLSVIVSLIGTLAAMYALGYSINSLTLFGLVLAIGIVVDDAIVVVEAVEFHIGQGKSPVEATETAMTEVAAAVIGVSLVLAAVFVPSAFLPGLTGQFFRQFAVTVAVSTILSAINSLTLSPALAALLLKPHGHGHGPRRDALPWVAVGVIAGVAVAALFPGLRAMLPAGWPAAAKWAAVVVGVAVPGYFLGWPVNYALGYFFQAFNWAFGKVTAAYGWTVGRLVRVSLLVLAVYGGLLALTAVGFGMVPGGFIPDQDQGYAVVNIQLPDGASLARSEAVTKQVVDICLGPADATGNRPTDADGHLTQNVPGVTHTTAVAGFSVFTQSNQSNAAGLYLTLDTFDRRKGLTAAAIVQDLNARLAVIQEASIQVVPAPPILGLGTGGFKMQVLDRQNTGSASLEGATVNLMNQVRADGQTNPGIPFVFSSYSSAAPQLFVTVDRERCQKMGVSVQAVNDTLQIYLGSLYVNDITLENRNWQVNIQADFAFRSREEDIRRLKVRGPTGEMIPIAGLIDIAHIDGPAKVNRYQMSQSADVNGITLPQFISTGQALAKMALLAKRELPPGMTFEWTDMAYQQELAANQEIKAGQFTVYKGDTTFLVFGLSAVAAFLVLAALYESWLLPLAVVLIVPMCLASALVGLLVRSLDLNIFTQIGLVVLVGLACKNAILIVEYAKQKREQGLPRWDAVVEAARQRLRPILMTSFAFILGVLPLVRAEGAGAEMRRALGTAVFSGMIGVTLFGIFFTPVFYVVLQRLRDHGDKPAEQKS